MVNDLAVRARLDRQSWSKWKLEDWHSLFVSCWSQLLLSPTLLRAWICSGPSPVYINIYGYVVPQGSTKRRKYIRRKRTKLRNWKNCLSPRRGWTHNKRNANLCSRGKQRQPGNEQIKQKHGRDISSTLFLLYCHRPSAQCMCMYLYTFLYVLFIYLFIYFRKDCRRRLR